MRCAIEASAAAGNRATIIGASWASSKDLASPIFGDPIRASVEHGYRGCNSVWDPIRLNED
jgi:hypothetical protein